MIYRGYAIFRKHEKSEVIILPKECFPKDDKGIHAIGELSSIGPIRIISINNESPLEEQIKTLIHELLHIDIDYENRNKIYPLPGLPLPKGMSEEEATTIFRKLEDDIKKETKIIYNNQPVLVAHLRRRIQKLYLEKLEYSV